MSIFDRFENAVERGVNGAFSRVFRSGIKPVDITNGDPPRHGRFRPGGLRLAHHRSEPLHRLRLT